MKTPIRPPGEDARIAALHGLNILDTPPEERFDRLTRIAKGIFGVRIAVVSLVDTNRQWFKSAAGLDARETPRDISFCGHAILGDDILLIKDALQDERFFDNPLVTGPPHIRFYAGCPLKLGSQTMGTLCLIDDKPREFSQEEHQFLRDLAAMAEQELAAIQLATTDELTALSNRRGFEAISRQALHSCRRMRKPATLLYFDLNNFKKINDNFGHAEGDRVLRAFAEALLHIFRGSDVIGRIGGDEFVVLLTNAGKNKTSAIVARMKERIEKNNRASDRGYEIQFSVGQIEYDPTAHPTIAALLAEADAAMYDHKRQSNGIKLAGG
jgi:diguanylate cyclase (GGDEF)-like protein